MAKYPNHPKREASMTYNFHVAALIGILTGG